MAPAPPLLPTRASDWRTGSGAGLKGLGRRSGRGVDRGGPRPLCPRRCARVGGVRAGTALSARCHPAPAAARWREGARGPSPREPPPAAGDPPSAPASMSPPAAAAPSVCSARASRRGLGHWPPDPRP